MPSPSEPHSESGQTCTWCATLIPDSASHCPGCGRSRQAPPPTPVQGWRRWWQWYANEAADWASSRILWFRLPLVVYQIWLAAKLSLNREARTWFDGINLGIHEAGHLLFAFAPRPIMAFGGTFLQCAAPWFAALVLARQRDHSGLAFCLTWLATNLAHVAVYMADARALELPLVTVGASGVAMPKEELHDWSYLLGWLGIRSWDTTLSGIITVVMVVMAWLAVAWGTWLLVLMWRRPSCVLTPPR